MPNITPLNVFHAPIARVSHRWDERWSNDYYVGWTPAAKSVYSGYYYHWTAEGRLHSPRGAEDLREEEDIAFLRLIEQGSFNCIYISVPHWVYYYDVAAGLYYNTWGYKEPRNNEPFVPSLEYTADLLRRTGHTNDVAIWLSIESYVGLERYPPSWTEVFQQGAIVYQYDGSWAMKTPPEAEPSRYYSWLTDSALVDMYNFALTWDTVPSPTWNWPRHDDVYLLHSKIDSVKRDVGLERCRKLCQIIKRDYSDLDIHLGVEEPLWGWAEGPHRALKWSLLLPVIREEGVKSICSLAARGISDLRTLFGVSMEDIPDVLLFPRSDWDGTVFPTWEDMPIEMFDEYRAAGKKMMPYRDRALFTDAELYSAGSVGWLGHVECWAPVMDNLDISDDELELRRKINEIRFRLNIVNTRKKSRHLILSDDVCSILDNANISTDVAYDPNVL